MKLFLFGILIGIGLGLLKFAAALLIAAIKKNTKPHKMSWIGDVFRAIQFIAGAIVLFINWKVGAGMMVIFIIGLVIQSLVTRFYTPSIDLEGNKTKEEEEI